MGIKNFSDDNVILVTLPEEPQSSDELETINEIIGKRCDCDVVVDFLRVKTLTSSNICNLIILNKLLTENCYQLILCNVSLLVKGIFTVIGLQSFFEFADDRYTALESIQHVS
ncbi:MAG: STAS domain-containing protein [Planctomycetota bacterium]|jgi:anti-anti-sigma regulatory factor